MKYAVNRVDGEITEVIGSVVFYEGHADIADNLIEAINMAIDYRATNLNRMLEIDIDYIMKELKDAKNS